MGIEGKGISYSYGQTRVLRGVDLRVETGEVVGIVGVSGGGKSTLLKLLSGLYAPQEGFLCVEGETQSARIRKKVAMVLQGAQLFPASIRENITCGHEMDDSKVRAACQAAQISDWIDSLPEGLNTFVGERGGKVSGGQAQRIAIARAIAKDAPVILLDEATSALDGETGAAVLTALGNLMKGKTVITVSHRPEALADCGKVYRLEGGLLRVERAAGAVS